MSPQVMKTNLCVCVWRNFTPWLWAPSSPYCKCQWWLYTTTALTLSIHCFLAHLLSMKGNFDVVICWTTLTDFLVFLSFISLWNCISVWTSAPSHDDVVIFGRRTCAHVPLHWSIWTWTCASHIFQRLCSQINQTSLCFSLSLCLSSEAGDH